MPTHDADNSRTRQGALITAMAQDPSQRTTNAGSADQDARRGALLDLGVWAGIPINEIASDGTTIRRIMTALDRPLDRLSTRGLALLVELMGIPRAGSMSRREMCRAVHRKQGWRGALRRHRRVLAGSMLSRLIHGERSETPGHPDTVENRERLRGRVVRDGVVAGLAGELRGAADDYVAQKLDEIERRIDRKLDEIEERVNQWRDREVAARKRAIKIALMVLAVVALLAVGYDYLRGDEVGPASPREIADRVESRIAQ